MPAWRSSTVARRSSGEQPDRRATSAHHRRRTAISIRVKHAWSRPGCCTRLARCSSPYVHRIHRRQARPRRQVGRWRGIGEVAGNLASRRYCSDLKGLTALVSARATWRRRPSSGRSDEGALLIGSRAAARGTANKEVGGRHSVGMSEAARSPPPTSSSHDQARRLRRRAGVPRDEDCNRR